MEYLVLIGITLRCYGWLGHHERRTRSLRRLRHTGAPRSEDVMGLEYIIMGLVSLLVGIYLVVALLRPDTF